MCTSDKFGCLNKLSPVEEGEPPYMIAGDFRGGIILSLYWMPFSLIPRHYRSCLQFFYCLQKCFCILVQLWRVQNTAIALYLCMHACMWCTVE